MNTAQKTDRIVAIVLVALVVGIAAWFGLGNGASGTSKSDDATSATQAKVVYTDYDGKKIGILTGTNMEAESFKYFPNSEYLYYDGYPNLNTALESGVIDAYLGDEPALKSIHAQQPQIDYIKERLTNNRYSFAFRKDDPAEQALLDQFNAFLAQIKADGTYGQIDATWFGTDESAKVVSMDGLTGENGTLHMAVCATDEPFCYVKDGAFVGYDIDVAVRFCRQNGYALEIGDMDFSARIPALASGMFEFTTTMNVTPEREEQVLFSEPVSEGGIVVAVRAEDLAGEQAADAATPDGAEPQSGDQPQAAAEPQKNIFQTIAESFEKNFIREDRWKLIVQGIQTTCLITVLAVAFGGVLAFGICLFRRTGSRLANLVSDIFVRLLQGTPTVVLLMILYYVAFARTGLDAIWVAVIGFALNFAAYGSEIMRAGINGVDAGQREAALALGYSERQAFYDFVFPQAALNFLPVLRGEAVSLLKSTSVVGYIAIQDLTKMSDIIRSRTYEAFFPLIATALIYFALAWIIAMVVRLVIKCVDPRSGKGGKASRDASTDDADATDAAGSQDAPAAIGASDAQDVPTISDTSDELDASASSGASGLSDAPGSPDAQDATDANNETEA